MSESEPKSNKEIVFRGKLFEIEHDTQPDGRVFEVARRAPGVRVIISDKDNHTILLTKEFRKELGDWDYRLPGGKVFDSLPEYDEFRKTDQDILAPALEKVKGEAAEEAGVQVNEATLFKKSTLGATVEWDLYIFEATDWQPHPDGQSLEHGEQIQTDKWVSYGEARQMILEGAMQEERVALILMQWLGKH
jgi:hypothetical protein